MNQMHESAQEKRSGEPGGLPLDVQGSSLRFTNHFYPTAQSHPGSVRIITAVGRATKGEFRSMTNITDCSQVSAA